MLDGGKIHPEKKTGSKCASLWHYAIDKHISDPLAVHELIQAKGYKKTPHTTVRRPDLHRESHPRPWPLSNDRPTDDHASGQ